MAAQHELASKTFAQIWRTTQPTGKDEIILFHVSRVLQPWTPLTHHMSIRMSVYHAVELLSNDSHNLAHLGLKQLFEIVATFKSDPQL
jgi:hypothetical protein